MVINPLIKLTACVYRPWIRDSRIIPAGDAIRTATGYSFPSGHTTTVGPLAGGMAVNLWEDKRSRAFSIVFLIYLCLTAFSRNYLGVHTPQDVCVGLIISSLVLFGTSRLFKWLDAHTEKENVRLLVFFLCRTICLIVHCIISTNNWNVKFKEYISFLHGMCYNTK